MIVCVAVIGQQNNPLFLQSFTQEDDDLKLYHIVHCSLDVIDERELGVELADLLIIRRWLPEELPMKASDERRVIYSDYFKVNNPKRSGIAVNEAFLGLLYPTESYKVYGYLTNTKVKFILITADPEVRDADARNFFRKFHVAYVDAVSNPFHVPGKKITSTSFSRKLGSIVDNLGSITTV